MGSRKLDTSQIEVVDEKIAEILRRKTPAERIQMAFGCNKTARLVIEGHLRTIHPDWTDQQVMAEVARRMLGGTT